MIYSVNVEDIKKTLSSLGGKASLSEIYESILKTHTEGKLPSNYKNFGTYMATIRRRIENHCPQSEDYDPIREALFTKVDKGIYELISIDKKIVYSPKEDERTFLPHRYMDGAKYVVSQSKFSEDYIYVDTLEEASAYIEAGLKIRMSEGGNGSSPSLISPTSLRIEGGSTAKETLNSELKKLAAMDLDSLGLASRRNEQVLLRKYLLNKSGSPTCSICGKTYPPEFLVAAHLKKRSKCTDQEKLDFENIAMLMCKLGCDDLYEKGYIYVDDGKVHQRKQNGLTKDLQNYIATIEGRLIDSWESSSKYFHWHKKKVAEIKE